jgi:benzoate membrane transport protein
VAAAFSALALLGIALPLFLVTMASQNIPGMAVLNANGYRPEPGPLFTATGLLTLAAAPFGAHAVNLAAITAAICAGPEAHSDPARRWVAALVAGAFYVLLGLAAGTAVALIAAAPPVLIQAVAGLALLGAFGGALLAALAQAEEREAAVVCFLVSGAGLMLLGIGGAFWGLVVGLLLRALARWRRA